MTSLNEILHGHLWSVYAIIYILMINGNFLSVCLPETPLTRATLVLQPLLKDLVFMV